MKKKVVITPDPKNPNLGTERGRAAVKSSLEQFGTGRSIVVTDDGQIVAGNKTYEQARELGLPIEEVETDGTKLIVVRRTDMKAGDPRALGLAVADNRTGELGLNFDPQVVVDVCAIPDIDVSQLFTEAELTAMSPATSAEIDSFFSEEVTDPPEPKKKKCPNCGWEF